MTKPFKTLIEEATDSKWRNFWFYAGGSIHGLWKRRQYSAIKDFARDMPKEAYRQGATLPNELLVMALEALESIAAFHLVSNPICEPEGAIHIVVNDTEIAREAVIKIISKLEEASK